MISVGVSFSSSNTSGKGSSSPASVTSTFLRGSGRGANLILRWGVATFEDDGRRGRGCEGSEVEREMVLMGMKTDSSAGLSRMDAIGGLASSAAIVGEIQNGLESTRNYCLRAL